MDGCTQVVSAAIERSISHDEIVHLPYADGLARQFLVEADDSAESLEAVEFWGEAEGRPWRVHLDKPERAAEGKE